MFEKSFASALEYLAWCWWSHKYQYSKFIQEQLQLKLFCEQLELFCGWATSSPWIHQKARKLFPRSKMFRRQSPRVITWMKIIQLAWSKSSNIYRSRMYGIHITLKNIWCPGFPLKFQNLNPNQLFEKKCTYLKKLASWNLTEDENESS